MSTERRAELCFNDWAGFYTKPIVVLGETPKRYRITTPPDVDRIRLAGRNRYLHRGQTALVPKTAVRFPEEPTR